MRNARGPSKETKERASDEGGPRQVDSLAGVESRDVARVV